MLLILAIAGLFLLPSPWGVVAVVIAAAVEVLEIGFWRRFLRRYRIQTGAEAMIGKHAEVMEGSSSAGRVRLEGEIWNARSEAPLTRGQTVRVTAIDGLTLVVEPVHSRSLGPWNTFASRDRG